jgi:hypothetical protein
MKTFSASLLTLLFSLLFVGANAQGFVNMDFERATIVVDASSQYYPNAVYASNALPGWTGVGMLLPNDVLYNHASLGITSVSILDRNGFPSALAGAFSVYLYGGGGMTNGASISQTGLVPADTVSLFFRAQYEGFPGGVLLVSLGGQMIPFVAVSTASNYTLYGGSVPAGLVGHREQLAFTVPNGVNNAWEIDDIQFSPQAIPEPSVFGLSALGAVLLGWHIVARIRQGQSSSKQSVTRL